jgi:magnesium-transporting ATPase (P-type)
MNTPLSSNDLAKILIFTLLMLPPVGLVVGVIPAIFLIFGIFMMKKTQEFSHIETAVRNVKIYLLIAIAIASLFALYWANQYFVVKQVDNNSYYNNPSQYGEFLMTSILCSIIPTTYFILLNMLFLVPLSNHREWVEKYGFFGSTMKRNNKDAEVDIIKGEKLRSYSVADELTKWAKLKVDGHISEEEYNEVRNKLLKK